MSSLKFNHDDDEEKLMVKALYVGKVDDEDDDSEADLWSNAYKDGHDFIRRQIKERKKIPMISCADNIPTQKKPAPKSSRAGERSIVLAPAGCCPCPSWQKEQVNEFSKIRLKLSQHMSLLKSSNQAPATKIPDKRNESLWCHLCFGSKVWKLIEESSEDESDIDVVLKDVVAGQEPLHGVKDAVDGQEPLLHVKDAVDGQEPLLHIISSMPNHVVEAVLEYQVSWLRKVGWFPGLGPWLYALLARLEKPLTPDTSSLIRSLALKASQERARIAKERQMQIKDGDPDVAACNLFVCLISEYFSQGDLADREEGDED